METMQWHACRKSPVFVANLDARKCFDRIWHAGLFARLRNLLSPASWLLLVRWYATLQGHVVFDGVRSSPVALLRGTRQGAILSPALVNVFLAPLVAELDTLGLGARLHGCHVPAVCYADDFLLLATNSGRLQKMLNVVAKFAKVWRLDFINRADPSRTKSHCIVLLQELFVNVPRWMLCGQLLLTKSTSEHLGITLDSHLSGSSHVAARVKKARGALFGLAPTGIFSSSLSPTAKAFLWRAVVTPSLLYGCEVAPLRVADVERLETCHASCLKAALRLSQTAHHFQLLRALRVSRIQDCLRSSMLRTLASACRSDSRLRSVILRGLANVVLQPSELRGSFLGQVTGLCNGSIGTLLAVCGGSPVSHLSSTPRADCGVVDSLRTAFDYPEPLRSSVIFSLCFGSFI